MTISLHSYQIYLTIIVSFCVKLCYKILMSIVRCFKDKAGESNKVFAGFCLLVMYSDFFLCSSYLMFVQGDNLISCPHKESAFSLFSPIFNCSISLVTKSDNMYDQESAISKNLIKYKP